MAKEKNAELAADAIDEGTERQICGLIMPISGMTGYEPGHWAEVRTVLERGISEAGFVPRPVWEGVDADIIHDRIVANLFGNPLAVCDVSGLSPNVMLELGMRLSFGKPTIIVTDDFSSLPFDTRMIEHIGYPRDLHLFKTETFINSLASKIKSVADAIGENKYKPFIRNFTNVEPGSIPVETRTVDEVILEKIERLGAEVRAIRRSTSSSLASEGGISTLRKSYWETDSLDILPKTLQKFSIKVPELNASKAIDILGECSNLRVFPNNRVKGNLRLEFVPWASISDISAALEKLKEAGIEIELVPVK